MAELISTAIVQAVAQRPFSEAYEEMMSLLVDLKSNMESLQNTRTALEAVLLDADSVVELSHAEKDSIEKIRRQVDRLVDLLDAIEDRAMRKQVMGGSRFIKEARLFFSPSNQLVARFMDARKVRDIRNKLDSISRDHAQFGSIVSMPSARQPRAWDLRTLDMFVVSERSSRSESKANSAGGLADLNKLNNIKGRLEIKMRKESRDIAAEAKAANLKMKAKLTHFSIDFDYSSKEDEMVLEGLQPHANLKFLRVDGYGGERLPHWMIDDQLYCWLPNLVEIIIINCKSCRYLCCLGWLPHLRDMYLKGLDNVEYIENNSSSNSGNHSESNNGDELFPNLKTLAIEGMPKLKGWRMSSDGNQDLKQLSQVQDQHQLVQWKPACPKLEELVVDNAELAITIAKGLLTGCLSLRHLSISENLTILLPQQRQTLVLLNNTFPTLRKLLLNGIDELEILPVEFQDYTSLESLQIRFCKQFREIPDWIDKLTSLVDIFVSNCPKLESLPHQISNLSKLRRLQVYRSSSLLEERCRKPSGECWPYIQHIPYVYISTNPDFIREGMKYTIIAL
ncbi:hypothetical protein BVRB_3g051380 [Beta vulgaris subsp. vulgaris]|nr:hypothetical protein BVRB_3g051380 [Beta vulgaris subsp. vulgaris]